MPVTGYCTFHITRESSRARTAIPAIRSSGQMTPCRSTACFPKPRTRLAPRRANRVLFLVDSRTIPLSFRSSQSPSRGESCETVANRAALRTAQPIRRVAWRAGSVAAPVCRGSDGSSLLPRRPVDGRRLGRRASARRIDCAHVLSARAIGPGIRAACGNLVPRFHSQLLRERRQRKLAGRIGAKYPAATLLASEPTSTRCPRFAISAVANA